MNASLAFTLKVTISLLIKECTAFVYILAGVVKDACRFLSRFRLETRHAAAYKNSCLPLGDTAR